MTRDDRGVYTPPHDFSERLRTSYWRGADAYFDGTPLSACPCGENRPLVEAWERGWCAARRAAPSVQP